MNECVDVSHNKEIEQKQPVSPKLKKVNTSCLVIGKIVANINPIGRPRIKKADRNLMHFNEKKTKIKRKKGNGSSGQSGSDDSGSEPVSQPNKKRKRSPKKPPPAARAQISRDRLSTREELNRGDWLTDFDIMTFLKPLRQHCLDHKLGINGLEDPLELLFGVDRRTNDFVRIVFVVNHRICCVGGEDIPGQDVCIYDSLPRSSIEPTLAAQAREWFPPEKAKIVFRVQKTQKQSGSFCGYFALAYAITKCLGENPEAFTFIPASFIDHFFKTIETQKISMFPNKKNRNANTADYDHFEI